MWIRRRRNNPKVVFAVLVLGSAIGWIGTGFGKYEHLRLSAGGYEQQQFLVGDSEEAIDVRLNIAGRNWELGFDEEEGILLVQQDGETLLEGWFVPAEEFSLWKSDYLAEDGFTTISDLSEEGTEAYFCASDDGRYAALTEIKDSESSAVFFTPDDTEIPQEKALGAFERLTITVNLPNA